MSYEYEDKLEEHDEGNELLNEPVKPTYELLSVTHEMADDDVLCFDCQKDVMALLGEKGRVIIHDMDDSNAKAITGSVRQPNKIFVSPNGLHVLVSSKEGELYYYSTKLKKAQTHFPVSSQGASRTTDGALLAVVECVHWASGGGTERSTGSIIAGSRIGGLIFELKIESNAQGANCTVCRPLCEVDIGEYTPITTIDVEKVNGETIIFVSTPGRLLKATSTDERLSVDKIISQAFSTDNYTMEDIQGSSETKGTLSIFRSSPTSKAQCYVWGNGMGICHAIFNHKPPKAEGGADDEDPDLDDLEPIVNNSALLLARTAPGGKQSASKYQLPEKAPTDVLATAFHVVLVYDERLIVLGHPPGLTWRPLSGSDVQEHDIADRVRFDPFRYRRVKKLLGIVRDVSQRRMYVYNAHSVWELIFTCEHKTQWKLFLERAIDPDEPTHLRQRYFRAAYNLCRHEPARRDLIQFTRGMFLLRSEKYEDATSVLAECNRFEEVFHTLTQLKKPKILLWFLEKRYLFVVKNRKSKLSMQAQIACLAVLLIQQKLEMVSRIEARSIARQDKLQIDSTRESQELTQFVTSAVKSNYHMFEDGPFYHMVARLITSQGRTSTMLVFAEKLHHVHYTISYCITQRNYKRACDVLNKFCRDETLVEVWYEFSPQIITQCPVKLITGMLRMSAKDEDGNPYQLLDVERLVPSFLSYKPEMNETGDKEDHQVITFLEQTINKFGCYSTVVHDFYVSLLTVYDLARLTDFLESPTSYYTVEYALRRCLDLQRFPQCIPLYKRLGLYEDAITMALECSRPEMSGHWAGLEQAKQILLDAAHDMDAVLAKRLWLLVAERVIDKLGTRQALAVVEESNGALKLEDVLSKINDSTVIQNFKEAVCRSLDEYTTAIAELNTSQREAKSISEAIKSEISQLRHRFGYVTSKQRCELCKKGLLQGHAAFLVYPSCRHVFHESCVVSRLEELGGISAFQTDPELPVGYLDGICTTNDLAEVECVFCGECAILEIERPFFMPGEDESWNVD
jgi:hypothetical protein